MKIILVRHGESEANRISMIQGHMDSPLSDLGKEQAQLLADNFLDDKIKFDFVYSSDLSRAAETAKIIAKKLGLKNIVFDKRLREFKLGIFEGKYSEKLTKEEQSFLSSCWKDYSKRIPNGETVNEMMERVKEIFDEIISNHKYGDIILIVGHGGTLFNILSLILHLEIDLNINWFENCKKTEIELNPKTKEWTLNTFNDKSMNVTH